MVLARVESPDDSSLDVLPGWSSVYICGDLADVSDWYIAATEKD